MQQKMLLATGLASLDPKIQTAAARLCHELETRAVVAQVDGGALANDRDCFNEHANFSVMHHMGVLAKTQARNLLVKSENHSGLALGACGVKYRIVPFSAEIHLDQFIARHRYAAKIVHSAIPATFAEYKALVDKFEYHDKWDVRSIVTPAREVLGLGKLVVPTSTTITQFTQVFPDQNGYLGKLGRQLNTIYATTIIKKLKYDKCSSFLTMDLCFAGMLSGFSVKWMRENCEKLKREQKKGMRRRYQRHVVKICQSVRKDVLKCP